MKSFLHFWWLIPSFIRPFKGGRSKVSKEIMLFVKVIDPESKAEGVIGNSYKYFL